MASPRRVLYLLDHVILGGGETSFLALVRRGLETGALTPIVAAPGRGPLTERLERLGIATEIIPYDLRFRRGLLPAWRPAAARAVADLARREGATLIHVWHFFGLLHGGPAARRLGLPLAWTCHGAFELANPARRWAARRWAGHAACVSESVRRAAAAVLGPDRARTNYLGIEPFDPAQGPADRASIRRELGEPDDVPIIAVVGRFQPIKGHLPLIEALERVRERAPGTRAWLIGEAFGPAEAEHKALVERWAATAGGVRLLGFRPDARRLMRALDALVIPSEAESFSMAAVEGLEAGIPVVGPDGGGPREIIDPPATGRLFRPGDGAELAGAILAALGREGFDPEAGPRRVGEQFSIDAHLERTMELYGELHGQMYRRLSSEPGAR